MTPGGGAKAGQLNTISSTASIASFVGVEVIER